MSSWRDYARKTEPPPADCAISAISANRADPTGTPSGTSGTVPASIVEGLAMLAKAPAPRLHRPEAWPQVVADAQRLASEGWAATALSLGWSELDLFGVVTNVDGDPFADGLAVTLAGRSVLAICDSFATVADPGGGRSYLYRHGAGQTLWAAAGG